MQIFFSFPAILLGSPLARAETPTLRNGFLGALGYGLQPRRESQSRIKMAKGDGCRKNKWLPLVQVFIFISS